MVELYVKDVYYAIDEEVGGINIQEDDEDKLLEHVKIWFNKLDGVETIKDKRFSLDVDGQDFPLVIMQGFLGTEPVNAFLGFKEYKEGVKLNFISYLDRDYNEFLLEGRDMFKYVKRVCKTFGVEPELKDKDKYLNEAKSYYIKQLNKVKKAIGDKFKLDDISTIYAEYHDEIEAPDEIDVGVSFIYDGENYHVNSTYFDGTGEEKKGVGFYFVHLKSNGEYNTDTEITDISKFKTELLKLHKEVKDELDSKNNNNNKDKNNYTGDKTQVEELISSNYKAEESKILDSHKNWIEKLADAPKGLIYVIEWEGSQYDDYSYCIVKTKVAIEGKGYKYINSYYRTYFGGHELREVIIIKSGKYNDILEVSDFNNVWNEFYNIFPKKLYANDSSIDIEESVDTIKKEHNNWMRSQEGLGNNTKTFIGSIDDLTSNGINVKYDDTKHLVLGDLIKNSDLGYCIYTLYIPSYETGTYLREVFIVDDYGTSKEVSKDSINQLWDKIKEDMLEKEWIYTDEKKQIIGRQINSYLRKLPNSNIKAEVEFNSIKQNKGEVSALLNYNVWLNVGGENRNIIKVDAKVDDNRKVKALRLKVLDKDEKEIVVKPKECWNVVNSLLGSYDTDGFVEFDDDDNSSRNKTRQYKGIVTENNKKTSVKKIDRLHKYLSVIKLPNIIKDTDEFGKVLLVGLSENLKYFVSSGVIYDVNNKKIVVKKDDVNGIKDMAQEFYNYLGKQENLKTNKNIALGVKMLLVLYTQGFDLRRPDLDEAFIKSEFEKSRNSLN